MWSQAQMEYTNFQSWTPFLGVQITLRKLIWFDYTQGIRWGKNPRNVIPSLNNKHVAIMKD